MKISRRVWSTPVLATAALVALALAVIVVPILSSQDPLGIGDVLALRLSPPWSRDGHGTFHLLGTDRFGRDLFVRMMLAGRVSLAVGIVGSLLASALGTSAAGIRSGRPDTAPAAALLDAYAALMARTRSTHR